MSHIETIQLREFCQLFEVAPREVRYILEEGFVPDGVRRAPSTGNRREFAPDQAFWLAIVLKLKHVGLKTPLAAEVTDYATKGVNGIAQNLSWDGWFFPYRGWFDTQHQYFVEVGDLKYIRLLTDSCPINEGLYAFDWHPVGGRRTPLSNVTPFVTLRVDLTLIANVLKKVDAWSQPGYTKRT